MAITYLQHNRHLSKLDNFALSSRNEPFENRSLQVVNENSKKVNDEEIKQKNQFRKMSNKNSMSSLLTQRGLFSPSSLLHAALLEEKSGQESDADSSSESSQGPDFYRNRQLTPYQEHSACQRLYRFLRTKRIEDLADILEKDPRVAQIFFKQLLNDSTVSNIAKQEYLSALVQKIKNPAILQALKESRASQFLFGPNEPELQKTRAFTPR